ncbi:translocon-associated protein (TRAP), alpha subunit [Actinidia rufa]|uniref:Translocon-associated protein subunit alpha n=1 Tax=Actinidia rufa TaxID=165716 RepID=A0A7J0FPM3_9ERIC|nr:translocon-associated protein (TRAP), alpha subunit [Actinidia rufa]
MKIRVFYILALLFLSSPFLKVARCQSDSDVEFAEVAKESIEGGDLGIIGEDVQDFGDGSFSPAPGVETVCVFPKNPSRSVVAGEESELLVGMKNEGELGVNVIAIKASVHLPYDHRMLVQNLTAQAFNNASVPPSAQATFPYIFAVSKFLQAGTFDLVGTIVYEIDQFPYQSTFYNGTFEVTEAGGPLSVESVFLFCLGISLLGLLGLWIRGQIQHLSKKTKRAPKVEVGTKTTDASMDEWLQALARSLGISYNDPKMSTSFGQYIILILGYKICGAQWICGAVMKTTMILHCFLEFVKAAMDAGEVVLDRGLLKGVGICHGISGNTYIFLALYRLTGKERKQIIKSILRKSPEHRPTLSPESKKVDLDLENTKDLWKVVLVDE